MSKEIQNVMVLHGYNEAPPIITGDYEYILEVYTDDAIGARQLSHKEIWINNFKNLLDIMACFKNKNKTAIPQTEEKAEKKEQENKEKNSHGEVTV